MAFDPTAVKRKIERDGVILSSNGDIGEFRPNAVGNAAVLSLLEVIYGWLAGERVRLSKDLDHIVVWLEDAEKRKESFGAAPWFHTARRKRALALARWLEKGGAERRLWHAAARTASMALSAGKVSQAEFAEYNLADGLLDFLLAGKRGEGKSLAAKIDEIPQAKWPAEALFALKCCEAPGTVFPDDWRRFLEARLKRWLDEGEFIRAAAWLKFFSGTARDAEAVLLKAYDFMPGLTRPSASGGQESDAR